MNFPPHDLVVLKKWTPLSDPKFHMSVLRDGADLPEADSPQVSPIEQCVDMEEGEVTLLVKVREVSEDLMK